ncbi:unnamed protein product [Cuscuta campestris]|uniref:Uncharacterized protein n=1 Tax=Cuscuta campestris TaxID=132261 RepID=A0A484L5W3_9ASTE|nr:unnamed protein product [Cuscuta campestris]
MNDPICMSDLGRLLSLDANLVATQFADSLIRVTRFGYYSNNSTIARLDHHRKDSDEVEADDTICSSEQRHLFNLNDSDDEDLIPRSIKRKKAKPIVSILQARLRFSYFRTSAGSAEIDLCRKQQLEDSRTLPTTTSKKSRLCIWC